ncbi:high affinity copper uptake protein 1-like [Saccoglossus kowalevskii]|uniref:Copper transport protein n=1 Tax=Saccoglossus kowalevskii TaxID=10224 RepID=A0ABM0M8Y5_SACKO|nr:PREDICTED: high affinity copper uptake protein 1-like [Saccoglossus kowalevskii]
MDHNNHMMMDTGTGMPPTAGENMSMTTMDMSGHLDHITSGDHSGTMMMMYFHFSTKVTILFKEWTIDGSVGAMLGSCIAIFFLAVFYEGLKVLRESLLRKNVVNVRYSSMPVGKQGGSDTVLTETHGHGRARILSLAHLLQSVLHVVQITISYFLMLIFMTYNVWLCIAVALGAGVGYFVFGWKKTVIVDINEHCH